MIEERTKLLIVLENDGDGAFLERMVSTLPLSACDITQAISFQGGIEHLTSGHWDIIVIDLFLSDGPAPNELFHIVRTRSKGASIIALSPPQDERLALQALSEGAHAALLRDKVDRLSFLSAIQSAQEQKRLRDQTLNRHEEALELAKHVSEGLLVLNTNQEAVFANSATASLLGQSVEVLLGQRIQIPLEKGSHQNARLSLECGSERTLNIDVRTSTWNTQPCLLVLLNSPNSRPDSTIEQSLQAQSLVSRQRVETLGLLAGGIAHDFNNLLAGILGHAEVLSLEISSNDPGAKSVDLIKQASKKAGALCQQLKGFSGEPSINPTACDLNEIVRDNEPLLRTSESTVISLGFELAPSLPSIVVDASQVLQIILNLVINAKEAVEDKEGIIRIQTREFRINQPDFGTLILKPESDTAQYVGIQVHDNGCGMSQETVAQSLEPFFSTKGGGRGLGLSTIQSIMKDCGGLIAVQSAPGKGTTISIAFPAASNQSIPIEDPIAGFDSSWRYTGNVLVVDDELHIRDVTSRMLQHFGCQVAAAASGAEALTYLSDPEQSFDIVLLDLSMPVQSGPATLRAIRDQSESIPVILMSGFAEEHSFQQIGECRIDGFLRKPFGVEALGTRLQTVLSRQPS